MRHVGICSKARSPHLARTAGRSTKHGFSSPTENSCAASKPLPWHAPIWPPRGIPSSGSKPTHGSPGPAANYGPPAFPRGQAHAQGLASLTPQQLQIAQLAAAGLTNKQIGERLYLSPRTVATHLHQLFPKLGVTTRAALRDALADPRPSIRRRRRPGN